MCCLFGLIDPAGCLTGRQKTRILCVLSAECEVRGTDATGIAYNSGGALRIDKHPLPAHKLHFRIPDDAKFIMGHTRMTTQGSAKRNYNNHPFMGKAGGIHFALAHNGVLHNDYILRQTLGLPSTKIRTDSYIAVQLIEQRRALDFASLSNMAEQVEGSFTFTVLDESDNLYVVKGDNPFCLYHFPKSGLYLYASTEEILRKALKKLHISRGKAERVDIRCGDILRIDCQGKLTTGSFDTCYFTWARNPFLYVPYGRTWERAYEQEYLNDLKAVASAYGYDPGQIESLLHDGFTTDELEELLYAGEL